MADRHPMMRIAQLVLGGLLLFGALLVGPLPGPGGIFLFAGGLILILRNSRWAQVRFARAKRRWPRLGRLIDRTMRRPSALRRHARDKEAEAAPVPPPALSPALTSPPPPRMRSAVQASPASGERAAFLVSNSGMIDEADLSAEQSGARAPTRLPRANGDGGRPLGDPRPPQPRPQEAVRLNTLTKRRDFLAANAGKRAPMPGFVLLVRHRDDGDPSMRVGFTVTKKIGNAVVRNRMKRRLRALFREMLPAAGVPGADHVLIGRSSGIERDFSMLRIGLEKALKKVAAR